MFQDEPITNDFSMYPSYPNAQILEIRTPDDRCPEDPSGTPSRLWPRMRLSAVVSPQLCCEILNTA